MSKDNSNNTKKQADVPAGEGTSSSSVPVAAVATATTTKKKKSGKKKKGGGSRQSPSSTPADEQNRSGNNKMFEEDDTNKRRDSLTDSPLTEPSPSSTISNGDSADDNDSSAAKCGSKQSSSENGGGSMTTTTSYGGEEAVNSSKSTKQKFSSSSIAAANGDEQLNDGGKPAFFPPFLLSMSGGPITEEENINEVEREYAYEILAAQKKHLIKRLKYNKWADELYTAILTGNFPMFYQRFKMVMVCLRKRLPHYRRVSDWQVAQQIAEIIVDRFDHREEQTTILMVLLANNDRNVCCSDRDHGYCRIAHMLLKLLKRAELKRLLLEVRTRSSGKTALHLAAATGQPCQLQVLLALTEIDANLFDKSDRAALHYAIERNNLTMVRLLMWYGADISLCYSWNAYYDPVQLSLCADPNSSVQHWLSGRVHALSRRMQAFVRQLCGRACSVGNELSPVHFVRFGGSTGSPTNNAPIPRECQLNMRPPNFSLDLPQLLKQNPKSKILLFMVPVSFRTGDAVSPAGDPQLVRVEFPNNSTILNPMISYNSAEIAVNMCNTVFSQFHNGYFYAFELNRAVIVEGLHKLIFTLKSSTGFTEQARAVLLAIQAYLCTDVAENSGGGSNQQHNNNNGSGGVGKTKLD